MRTFVGALVLAAAAALASAQTPGRAPRAAPDSPAPGCVHPDSFGNLPRADEERVLDRFAAALGAEPRTTLHVIAYGGRRGPRGEALARLARARCHLVGRRGIDAARVVTVDGGYREEAYTELWVTPPGAAPPAPSPTVYPSDAVFTDRRPGRGRRKQAGARKSSRSE